MWPKDCRLLTFVDTPPNGVFLLNGAVNSTEYKYIVDNFVFPACDSSLKVTLFCSSALRPDDDLMSVYGGA